MGGNNPPVRQPIQGQSGGPAQSQSPFSGSVPAGLAAPGALALSLQDAIQRGLKQNLGAVLGDLNTRLARAEQLRAHAQLLPDLTGRVGVSEEQVNLAAFGFQISIPGVPKIVGPFHIFDARAYLTQSVVDFQRINNSRAAHENVRALEFTQSDARDLVSLLVGNGYLVVIADAARVEEARAEVNTAQALYQKASDQLKAGIAPALDALRAQVELQSEQTRLRQLQNDFAKDKLGLARLIGLPLRQEFTLADTIPYRPLEAIGLNEALDRALKSRADYQSGLAQVRAAEFAKRAAVSERLPAVDLNADYGDIGTSPLSSHGTFTVTGSVRFSIFDGGRIRSDIEQADAQLSQRKAELADLRERIEYDIRSALLDLETAADQVRVAQSSAELARRALEQARDRFSAGVADNIEVVQAQTAVAAAANTYIDSIYAHNVAKAALARAVGTVAQDLRKFLEGQ